VRVWAEGIRRPGTTKSLSVLHSGKAADSGNNKLRYSQNIRRKPHGPSLGNQWRESTCHVDWPSLGSKIGGADVGVYCVHLKSNLVRAWDKEAENAKNICKREVAADQLLAHMHDILRQQFRALKASSLAEILTLTKIKNYSPLLLF
jgi:hypothetical protein